MSSDVPIGLDHSKSKGLRARAVSGLAGWLSGSCFQNELWTGHTVFGKSNPSKDAMHNTPAYALMAEFLQLQYSLQNTPDGLKFRHNPEISRTPQGTPLSETPSLNPETLQSVNPKA